VIIEIKAYFLVYCFLYYVCFYLRVNKDEYISDNPMQAELTSRAICLDVDLINAYALVTFTATRELADTRSGRDPLVARSLPRPTTTVAKQFIGFVVVVVVVVVLGGRRQCLGLSGHVTPAHVASRG